ncbi:perlucin-like protein isoform X1 [Ruditapes philippinarum]|uniref:perlucin-like protein isoform X1 n=1 Tax=Ruditapes philippinarum TaxID=129788 RepID=UPI00295B012B|nr:perlucin-like protein isoform X1 [Ruditapes philippinarum]
MSNMAISKLQGQHQEHLEISERRFSIVQKQFSCPDDTWKKYGNKCYRFVGEGDASTWSDAKEKCRLIHGDLVRIENKEENDFIANIRGSKYGYWIGLEDTQNENDWQWRSSEGTQSLGNFSAWAPNEPNNMDGNENCGVIYTYYDGVLKGQWNDENCMHKNPYICEIVKPL